MEGPRRPARAFSWRCLPPFVPLLWRVELVKPLTSTDVAQEGLGPRAQRESSRCARLAKLGGGPSGEGLTAQPQ